MIREHGLKESDFELILSLFALHSEIEEVVLFGSRVKNTARSNSDIDLAVKGINDLRAIEALIDELNELPLPYSFNVLSLDASLYAPLLEHIKRAGKIIYKRN